MLEVLLDVAELHLNLAEVLLNVALCLHHLVANEFPRGFLDGTLRHRDSAFHLIFVDAHAVLLAAGARNAPTGHVI